MAGNRPRIDKRALFESLGYYPHAGQREIHASRAPRRVVACGVRWGKTMAASMEALAAALQPAEKSIGWIVAPTYDLSERVFNQLAITVASHLRHHIVLLREHERRLVIRNMGGGLSEIRGKSADNPTSLLGEGLDFVVVDEASRLKPAIWQNHLSQRLLDKRGWALMISTPRGKGWFYDLWQRGQGRDPAYASWNMPSRTNPLLDAASIEAERSRLPERVFRQEYGAEFLEGSGSVFRNVRDRALLGWQKPIADEGYFAGLDLAKVEDYSVLVVVNKKREVCFVDRFHRLDWALQVNRIKAACDRYNHCSVLVDSTGAGEPVYEALRAAGCAARSYPFTMKSKNDLVTNLALMFEKGEITLPRADVWPEGVDELEAFEYAITEQGNVRTTAPSGQHDDCVVALALAAWQVRPSKPEPTIIILDWSP